MLSRRQLLRGDFSATVPFLAPPWASADFLARCTRCDDCIDACPTGVLVRGDGGYPATDYRLAECSFCGDCVTTCKAGALARAEGAAAWLRSIVIEETCLTRMGVVCRSCGEHCEARAIRFAPQAGGVSNPTVTASACTGCGACVAVCPNAAIRVIPNTVDQSSRRAA